MKKLLSAVVLAMLSASAMGAGSPSETTFKTTKTAPSGFTEWTFYWTMPELEEGATLQYVVLQPDGKEYYRITVPPDASRPGQKERSDFRQGFAGGDPKVLYGKTITVKFIASKGAIRFREGAKYSFEFRNIVSAIKE